MPWQFRPLLPEKFSKKSENWCVVFMWWSVTYLNEIYIIRVSAYLKRPLECPIGHLVEQLIYAKEILSILGPGLHSSPPP